MSKGKRIGYIRVSTVEQNTARQLQGIQLDKTFTDYFTGKKKERPQLSLLLDYIREDDLVIVDSLDRLGRNNRDLLSLMDQILKKGATLEFVKEKIKLDEKSSPMTKLYVHMFSAFSEFEIENRKESQRAGIAVAKALGKYKGRKRKVTDEQIEILRQTPPKPKSKDEIAKEFGVCRYTIYKYLAKIKQQQKEVA